MVRVDSSALARHHGQILVTGWGRVHFAAGLAFGMNVGNFLERQGAFEGMG